MDVEVTGVWKLSGSVEVRPEVEVFTDHEGKSRMPLTTVKCSLKSTGTSERNAGVSSDESVHWFSQN